MAIQGLVIYERWTQRKYSHTLLTTEGTHRKRTSNGRFRTLCTNKVSLCDQVYIANMSDFLYLNISCIL
jgi:hypothetical protein